MGCSYWRDCLSPLTSAHPIKFHRKVILRVPFAKNLHVGVRSYAFSIVVPPYRISSLPPHPKIRLAPSFLIFQNALKIWSYYQAWGSQGTRVLSRCSIAEWGIFIPSFPRVSIFVFIVIYYCGILDFYLFYIGLFYLLLCTAQSPHWERWVAVQIRLRNKQN